jgi:hypothetical protein
LRGAVDLAGVALTLVADPVAANVTESRVDAARIVRVLLAVVLALVIATDGALVRDGDSALVLAVLDAPVGKANVPTYAAVVGRIVAPPVVGAALSLRAVVPNVPAAGVGLPVVGVRLTAAVAAAAFPVRILLAAVAVRTLVPADGVVAVAWAREI